MWLPHLADVARMTQRAVAPRRRARVAGHGDRGAAARRATHAPAPPGVTPMSRVGDVPRHHARRSAGAAVRQGLPRRRRQRGGLAAGAGAPARGAEHAPARARPRRLALPRGPAAHRPARPRHPAAGGRHPAAGGARRPRAAGGSRAAGDGRALPAGGERDAATRGRAAPARPPSSPSTSPTGPSPTSRPGTRRCGPRRTRLAACGSPNRWPSTRYDGCCGPAGWRGVRSRRPCARTGCPRRRSRWGALLAALHASSVATTVAHRRRRPAGRGAQEGGQAGPGPRPRSPRW